MTFLERIIRASAPSQRGLIKGRLLALAIGLIFGGGGIAVLWSSALGPILKNQEAQHWRET